MIALGPELRPNQSEAPVPAPGAPRHYPFLRALAHRNFRLYLAGQGTSIIGSWVQQVAMAWLVYQLTGSAVWLGVVGFAGQIPALFLTPFAGALIDRTDRHRLLLWTQALALAQALLLAGLTLTGLVGPWHVVALALFLGTVNACDTPTRQSFLSEMVGKGDDLANAIALNSSVFNGARLVGPAVAGALLCLTSPGVCFLVNAASYLALLAALFAMDRPRRPRTAARGRLLGGLCEGVAYAWRQRRIRALLLLIGVFNLAGMAETTLLPLVATEVLGGEAATLALLAGAAGGGAFAAALFLAARRGVRGLDRWVRAMPLVFGLGLVALSFAATAWGAALALTATGFALLLMTAGANTLLQALADEDKRGRVLSLYTTAVTGLAPLGGLAAGLAADAVGAAPALRATGLACVAAAAVFGARTRDRGAPPDQRLETPQ